MLVNDTENHAHQGLATFLYRGREISSVRVQFVQQTAPYLLSPHCVIWGTVPATVSAPDTTTIEAAQAAARSELAARLPARPLAELRARLPKGALDGLGGPVLPNWQVALGLVYQGTLYYEALPTAYGDYPYPLEMRFGVRSVMKSVAVPLSLLHLAQAYGPYVLNLRIGDYVPGLDPKWNRIRFIDAANMATGFGGTGTFQDAAERHVRRLSRRRLRRLVHGAVGRGEVPAHECASKAYPWEPGTVMRYRDQDFFVLGLAIDCVPEDDARSRRRCVGPCCGTKYWHPSASPTHPRCAHANGWRTRRPGLVQRGLLSRRSTTSRRSRCCTRMAARTTASRSCTVSLTADAAGGARRHRQGRGCVDRCDDPGRRHGPPAETLSDGFALSPLYEAAAQVRALPANDAGLSARTRWCCSRVTSSSIRTAKVDRRSRRRAKTGPRYRTMSPRPSAPSTASRPSESAAMSNDTGSKESAAKADGRVVPRATALPQLPWKSVQEPLPAARSVIAGPARGDPPARRCVSSANSASS